MPGTVAAATVVHCSKIVSLSSDLSISCVKSGPVTAGLMGVTTALACTASMSA